MCVRQGGCIRFVSWLECQGLVLLGAGGHCAVACAGVGKFPGELSWLGAVPSGIRPCSGWCLAPSTWCSQLTLRHAAPGGLRCCRVPRPTTRFWSCFRVSEQEPCLQTLCGTFNTPTTPAAPSRWVCRPWVVVAGHTHKSATPHTAPKPPPSVLGRTAHLCLGSCDCPCSACLSVPCAGVEFEAFAVPTLVPRSLYCVQCRPNYKHVRANARFYEFYI